MGPRLHDDKPYKVNICFLDFIAHPATDSCDSCFHIYPEEGNMPFQNAENI